MILYIIYLICSPIIWFAVIISTIFNSKIRSNYFFSYKSLTKARQYLKNNNKEILLFHAASAGEFEQMKPLLRLIDREKYIIIQSFTSSSIYNNVKENNLFDIKCYQPIDFIWASYIHFKSINPSKYIITRHDLWPHHIMIAKILGVEIYFINANIHKNSIWYHNFMIPLTKYLFNQIKHIHVPSNRILNNLQNKKIYQNSVSVSPDSRIAQVQFRSQNNTINFPQSINKKNTVIFGSIDSQDEDIIISTLNSLYGKNKKNIKKTNQYYLLVPHEPTHHNLNLLYQKLHKINLEYSLLDFNQTNFHNIIIVNQVGILADLYKIAHIAYVGGGFTRGVHSVLEPAVYNCKIAFGPNIEMLDEAQHLIKHNQASLIYSAFDLINFLNNDSENMNSTFFNNPNIAQEILNQILYTND